MSKQWLYLTLGSLNVPKVKFRGESNPQEVDIDCSEDK